MLCMYMYIYHGPDCMMESKCSLFIRKHCACADESIKHMYSLWERKTKCVSVWICLNPCFEMASIGEKREWDVSEIEEGAGIAVHGIPLNVSPVRESRKKKGVYHFNAHLSDGKRCVHVVLFDTSHLEVMKKSSPTLFLCFLMFFILVNVALCWLLAQMAPHRSTCKNMGVQWLYFNFASVCAEVCICYLCELNTVKCGSLVWTPPLLFGVSHWLASFLLQ